MTTNKQTKRMFHVTTEIQPHRINGAEPDNGEDRQIVLVVKTSRLSGNLVVVEVPGFALEIGASELCQAIRYATKCPE